MSEYTFDLRILFFLWVVWTLLPYVASFVADVFGIVTNLESGERGEKQQEVQEEGFKREPSRWDWTEYRRHRHEETFVEASMWLSMGDD